MKPETNSLTETKYPARSAAGYFDWASTAPSDDDIIAESVDIAREFFGNPSSAHETGKKAREKLEEARGRCAKVLGVVADKLFFTSGGTEADQIPLLNLLAKPNETGAIAVSDLEHPAVDAMADSMKTRGWKISRVKSEDGFVPSGSVRAALAPETRLVCVTAVGNETGAAQRVYDIADEIASFYEGRRRAKFHVDAVQAAGKIPFNVSYRGIDSVALCAHKIGGPRGIGLLYLAEGGNANGFLRGGGQESGVRSGTENLLGAWAFSRCLERYYIAHDAAESTGAAPPGEPFSRYLAQTEWTREFLEGLLGIPGCSLVPAGRANPSAQNAFSPWIVRAAFKGIPGGVMQRALDAKGFAVSTGSACSSRDPKSADSPVRFSFGHKTTHDAMRALLEAVRQAAGLRR